jgi:hypothetical protein
MEKIWKYIEAHHNEYGVALFIAPVLLLALAFTGIGYVVSEMCAR